MIDYDYWILYPKADEKKALVLKSKTDDYLCYNDICEINHLNPSAYYYECMTGLGLKTLFKVFFNFANENLKSKEVDLC